MAWEYPKHECGHEGERYQAYGKMDARSRELEYKESKDCPDCLKKEAEKNAEEQGLVLLRGSSKQISWAHQIRNKAKRVLSSEVFKKYEGEDRASWWIDKRSALDRFVG